MSVGTVDLILKLFMRNNGKITFTELQKEWVKYRNLYKDYRAASNSQDRKNIMDKIMKVKVK